jgi:hypothetical protein
MSALLTRIQTDLTMSRATGSPAQTIALVATCIEQHAGSGTRSTLLKLSDGDCRKELTTASAALKLL